MLNYSKFLFAPEDRFIFLNYCLIENLALSVLLKGHKVMFESVIFECNKTASEEIEGLSHHLEQHFSLQILFVID